MASFSPAARIPSPGPNGISALLKQITELRPLEFEQLEVLRREQKSSAANGKPLSDLELAFAVFAQEAESLLNISKGRSRDGLSGDDLLEELLEMEDTARYDREFAVALATGRDPPPRPARLGRRSRARMHDTHGAAAPTPMGRASPGLELPTFSYKGKGRATEEHFEAPSPMHEEAEESRSASSPAGPDYPRLRLTRSPDGGYTAMPINAPGDPSLDGVYESRSPSSHSCAAAVLERPRLSSLHARAALSHTSSRPATPADLEKPLCYGHSEGSVPASRCSETPAESACSGSPTAMTEQPARHSAIRTSYDDDDDDFQDTPSFRSKLGKRLFNRDRSISSSVLDLPASRKTRTPALLSQPSPTYRLSSSITEKGTEAEDRFGARATADAILIAPSSSYPRVELSPRPRTERTPTAPSTTSPTALMARSSALDIVDEETAGPGMLVRSGLCETMRLPVERSVGFTSGETPSDHSAAARPFAGETTHSPVVQASIQRGRAMAAPQVQSGIEYSPARLRPHEYWPVETPCVKEHAARSESPSRSSESLIEAPTMEYFVPGGYEPELARDDGAALPEPYHHGSPPSESDGEFFCTERGDAELVSAPTSYEEIPRSRARDPPSPASRPTTPLSEEGSLQEAPAGVPFEEAWIAPMSTPARFEPPSLVGFAIPQACPSPESPALRLREMSPQPPSECSRGETPVSSETCLVCRGDIEHTVVRARCGHTFDVSCLQDMFSKATIDESVFPPKCCERPVELADVERHLVPALVARFRRKAAEFNTANRVYCHNRRCSGFLGAATTSPSVLYCAQCASNTCSSCKQQAHLGTGCRSSGGDDAVLALGKAQGWRRCPSCQHLIELAIGCYHVVCRCGKQFCYLCGVPWKGCKCELFDVPPEEEEGPAALRVRAAPVLGLAPQPALFQAPSPIRAPPAVSAPFGLRAPPTVRRGVRF